MMRISGYEVLSEIGSGGMGMVYHAIQTSLDRPVAIKVVHKHLAKDPSIRTRFFNEAKLTAALSHPHIVQLYDFLESDDELLIVMEYIEGRCLSRMIGQEVGPIPWEKALPLFGQVLSGVGYAHSRGVVHRDIKPANILVSASGDVKITDFGIAKIAGQKGMTRTGAQMGTLYYESPEQIRGARDVDHRADIYALGMTLYEMLAGRLPFDEAGDTSEFQVMNTIVNRVEHLDPRIYYPHIPEWLVGVVQKATELGPEARHQNCDAFLKALEQNGKLVTGEYGYWSGKVASLVTVKPISFGLSPSTPTPTSPERTCPKCGAPVEKEMEFCGECGADLQQECPGCKTRIRWNLKHCPKCGVNIEKKMEELEAAAERKKKEEARLREEARIVEEQRKAEEVRLAREWEEYYQKKAEEKQQKAEDKKRKVEERRHKIESLRMHSKEWWNRIGWKIAVIVAVVGTGAGITIGRIEYINSDEYKYIKALSHETAHKWEDAASTYRSIEGYRDAGERALYCMYQYANQLQYSEDYQAATEIYLSLGIYQDSESRVHECNLCYAEELALSGAYDVAATIINDVRSNYDVNEEVLYHLYNSYPLLLDFTLPDNMHFVELPSGSFQMGGNSYSWEQPVRTVAISRFEIMNTEVTQGMWQNVMGTSIIDQASQSGVVLAEGSDSRGQGEDYPMYYVSWLDCHLFLDSLNALDPSHIYRLPSEAEWEYVCRAGSTAEYPWGNAIEASIVEAYAWYGQDQNSGHCTQVAQKEPNMYGLFDTCGNVWEWCEDRWHDSYHNSPADGSPWVDGSTNSRVVRGGSWFSSVSSLRSAARGSIYDDIRSSSVGFRVVREPRIR